MRAPSRGGLDANRVLAPAGRMRAGGLAEDEDDELGHRNGYLTAFSFGAGELVVLDESRLRWYSAEGRLVATAGRAGSGPGESRLFTNGCATRGDTIVAFDNGTRRLTVAARGGRIVRQVSVARAGYLLPQGCFADGTLAFERRSVARPELNELIHVDLEGRELGILATYPARRAWSRVLVAVRNASIVIADPLGSEIVVLDSRRRRYGSIRFDESPGTLSARDLSRLGVQPRAGSSAPVAAPSGDQRRPLFSQVHVGRDRTIWYREFVVGLEEDAAWTGVSIESGGVFRFRLSNHFLRSAWPPALLLDVDTTGALFRFNDAEHGAATFSFFALRREPRD